MLTLFPRIRPNPVMPPPPAPPEEKEAAAEISPSEESQPNPDVVANLASSAEAIAEPVVSPDLQEPAEASFADPLPFTVTIPEVGTTDAAEAVEAREFTPETVDVVERREIDSSLIEGPEMVAAFLSSLKEATKKEEEDAEASAAPEQGAAPEIEIAGANIYDEIEILHEADTVAAPAEANVEAAAVEESITPEVEAEVAAEAIQPDVSEAQDATLTAAEVVREAAPLIESAAAENETVGESAQADEVAADAVEEAAPSTVDIEVPSSELAEPVEAPEIVVETLVRAAKRKRPEGLGFFELERIPEPEAMEDSGEVEAYASAAAQSYLDAIDDTFVAHAQLLLKGRERGRALDIGTGPGQIVLKLGYQLTRWKFVGVDRSAAMIEKAREGLESAPELAGRVEFQVADGNRLDFPNASFDLVVCNSVLHHLAEPQNLFSEIARLVKPDGAILFRDLRRPQRFEFRGHVRKHGKHYSGEMKRLFIASVQAAYTPEELEKMVLKSQLKGVKVFRHGKTHIGFAREANNRSR